MQTENKPVIQTSGLTKTFKGTNALQNLDLQVPQHSICGFLGPNGAGKSTTIKLLLGLTRPTSGSAKVFGMDCVRDSVTIRQRVGYLAQDPRYYDHMTARETLRFTAKFFYSGPSRMIEERINETLELVGIADKADRPIKGFSGGERQRLGIAQAQINYPDLIILDEPAASLDPMGRRDVLEDGTLCAHHESSIPPTFSTMFSGERHRSHRQPWLTGGSRRSKNSWRQGWHRLFAQRYR
jgi:ABC-2 type transport system ATP-binding protein